ncbi:MAG: M55 family metallopeptidase [Planctomycetota bacterium]
MKIYIQTDIEGVAGFVFFENQKSDTLANQHHRRRMNRLLTAEVNAAVLAAFESGAEEVVVNDSHGSGYNILFEELDPRCSIIHGRNFSGPHWLPELDASFAALVLVGMHAMGGTENAVLPHSRYTVNGGATFLSEGSMAAALAGHHGVPTVFVSGDDKVTAELAEKIPEIETAVVKKGLGCYQARSLMPARACALIREGVSQGIARRTEIPPYEIPGPIELNLLDSEGHAPPLKPLLEEAVVADDINTAFLEIQRKMPWTKFPVPLPDGFTFPQ